MTTYKITPVPKPRMTRRDKWLKRPCTSAYWHFKDQVKILGIRFDPGDGIRFVLQMPASWSEKRRLEMGGKPHTVKPDLDNLLKAITDAVYPDHDQEIWCLARIEKVWGETGAIVITKKRFRLIF